MRPLLLILLSALLAASAPPTPQITLETAVIAEINYARANPKAYANRLREYRKGFRGNTVYYPGNRDGLYTYEGVAAVDEAIRFLDRQTPLGPLRHAPLLARAARDHIDEQGPRGVTGHESRNGDRAAQRVLKRGGGTYVAENITYGPPSAAEVVRQLIVDDGVPGRGHRRVIYAGEFRFAGAACGGHRVYRHMCVIVSGRTADGH
ncbi:CAP domain-containing protein [Sphingomonas sp. AOB5]|uniref:CAP domain-containing protein n=1 Tax=Sphingomonas sp. AOB5 TaxID=3034017 RepID=UPI0023F96119|nr:CAP domain-containing protein [Sphingomonas sp. AOB5]MDF7774027.1 CAP domain-containing protein [Sphingomonas sp. AOB5]